jgi:hypothetical protein
MPTAPTPPRRRTALHALVLPIVLSPFVASQPAHAQRPESSISVSVPGGPAGAEVTVRVQGLTPGMPLQLGFGGLASNHEILGTGAADPDGSFSLTARVPEWVERHRTYHFFVNYVGQPPRTVSDPFIATAADGFVRVAGSITTAAQGCTLMRAFDDAVYALLGETGRVETGTRVVVEGTLAADAAPASTSACGDQPSIPVRIRQVLPG